MNVLCHGVPFCCDWDPVTRYGGGHDVRVLGVHEGADYRYDPVDDRARAIIERIGREWRPDLLLCWTPEMYPPPRGIEDAPVKTVALVSDWNVYIGLLRGNLARYDVVLCDRPGVDVLKDERTAPAYAMPLYSHVSSVHRNLGLERDIDVLFLGNLNAAAHATRTRLLGRIATLPSNIRVVISENLPPAQYAELMSRSRVVFNHSIRGEINLRVFETMACGALAMLEDTNREVHDWFAPGAEIVLYNETNLVSTLLHYVHHEAERRHIAGRGQSKAAAMAGEHRFDDLIDFCVNHPGSGRKFDELSERERAFCALRQYAGGREAAHYPLEEACVRRVVDAYPDDPRSKAAEGAQLLNPHRPGFEPEAAMGAAAGKFYEAHRLQRDAVVWSMNAATVFRAAGRASMDRRCLEAVLKGNSVSHGDWMIGSPGWPFVTRWRRALAERSVSVDAAHGEAHVRLAAMDLSEGKAAAARAHIEQAEHLDPNNDAVHLIRSALREREGALGAAASALRKYVKQNPFDLERRERLAQLLDESGEAGRAEEARHALELVRARLVRPSGAMPG